MARARRLVGVVALVTAAAVFGNGPADACDVVVSAAGKAARHLLAVQDKEGMFPYGYDFSTRSPVAGDNIVRRAGGAFALAEFYAHSKDDTFRPGVMAAIQALAVRSIVIAGGAVVSADGSAGGALTGATALALLAELHAYRTSGDGRFAAVREAWRRGLRNLWQPGVGFRASPSSSETSDYFNGEAWLALAYLEATTEDASLVDWLADVDHDLMVRYAQAPSIGFYHWGVMAAGERYARTGDRRFRDFALEQTRAFLDVLRPEMHPDNNTCYALEGLLTARRLAADDPANGLAAALDPRLDAELRKNLRLQIGSGFAGDGGQSWPSIAVEDFERYRGAFLAGRARAFTRIDHTQHCLSALIRAERIQLCPPAASEPQTREPILE